MTDIRCESCDGKGWSGPVHMNMGNGKHEWRERMDCYNCGGKGVISPEQWNAQQIGERHRHERISRDESLREPATHIDYKAALFDTGAPGTHENYGCGAWVEKQMTDQPKENARG